MVPWRCRKQRLVLFVFLSFFFWPSYFLSFCLLAIVFSVLLFTASNYHLVFSNNLYRSYKKKYYKKWKDRYHLFKHDTTRSFYHFDIQQQPFVILHIHMVFKFKILPGSTLILIYDRSLSISWPHMIMLLKVIIFLLE